MKHKGFTGLAALRGQLVDATLPVASNAELEAAIEERPNDLATYLAYADFLEGARDPRGQWIALHRAAVERPDDAAVAEALRRYLDQHQVYLLGILATAIVAHKVRVTWFMGFLRSVSLEPTTTALAIELLDAIAVLPSARFLRELTIAESRRFRHWEFKCDEKAVEARLVLLKRPTTLEQIQIMVPKWTPSTKLRRAFPRFGETLAAFDRTLATVRATGVTGEIDWSSLHRFSNTQVRRRLGKEAKRLDTPVGEHHLEVDTEVYSDDEAILLGGGRVPQLVVPSGSDCVLVEGDLIVDGVFEQPFRSCPVMVFGSLTCHRLCTDGYLVVVGDLVVNDLFYGCCTNYATIVFGAARIGTLLLDKNHHFAVQGKLIAPVHLSDEEDGYEAIAEHLAGRGLSADQIDASTLAALLRG